MTTGHYEFNAVVREGKWLVKVDPSRNYGYFEHDDEGEGGGLWFKDNALVDYDGRAMLPKQVASAIRALGYVVTSDFE